MKRVLFFLSLFTLLISCQEKTPSTLILTEDKSSPTVVAVNYPLAYFAQRIAGDHFEILFPMEGKGDPAYWSPTEEDIKALQDADLILLNGAHYAKWINKVSLPSNKLFITSHSFKDQYIKSKSETHTHGPKGEHFHAETASTTWLDFQFAQAHAEAILFKLKQLKPELSNELSSNCDQLISEIQALDSEMLKVGESLKTSTLFASHPVYQYLEKRYGLSMKSLHWEPVEFPSSSEWDQLKKSLSKNKSTMIWEAEPLAETRTQLEYLGLTVLVFDPCANQPKNGDWISVMNDNINRLKSHRIED